MTREEAIGILKNTAWLGTDKDREETEQAVDMAIEALQVEPTKAVCDDCIWHVCNYNKVDWDAPSSEAEPIVIRSKTLMPTKDFKEWAKRIREENPNAVVLPCDAEVVSAEAEWTPCSERLPDVDVEVLTTTDWSDVLIAWIGKGGAWETEEHILDNDEILAWMPLPEPYREDGEA